MSNKKYARKSAMAIPALLALLVLIAAVWFAAAGPWYIVPMLYFVGGFLWVVYERRRPPMYRSMAYMSLAGTVFLVVIWPLRAATDLLETTKLRRSSERYVVVDGDITKFGRWEDAVQAARDEAKLTQQQVMVLDQATFSKQLGRTQHKSWFVEPDGSVNLLPRSFL